MLLAAAISLFQVKSAAVFPQLGLPGRGSLGDPLIVLAFLACLRTGSRPPLVVRQALGIYLALLVLVALVVGRDAKFWLFQLGMALVYYTTHAVVHEHGVLRLCRLALRWWLAVTVLVVLWMAWTGIAFQYVAGYQDEAPWLALRLSLALNHSNSLASYLLCIGLVAVLSLRKDRVVLLVLLPLALWTKGRDLLLLVFLVLVSWLLERDRRWWLSIPAILVGGLILFGCLTREFAVVPRVDFSRPSLYRAEAHEPYARAYWQATPLEQLVGRGPTLARDRAWELKSPEQLARAMNVGPTNQADLAEAMARRPRPHHTVLDFLNAGGLLWLTGFLVLVALPLRGAFPVRSREGKLALLFLILLGVASLSRDLERLRWFWVELALCQAVLLGGRSMSSTG